MSKESATNLVDHSISGAFLKFRLPAMIAWLSAVVLTGFASGWKPGPVPAAMAVLGLGHAIYERRLTDPDPAIGLSIDVVVLLSGVWLGGSPSSIMAFAMMFVVLASFVVDGWRRAVLLVEIFGMAGAALVVGAPNQLVEGDKWFVDLLVLQNHASVGLGLWLSRNLARAMDGELVYRRQNGWTVFDLRLPVRQEPTMTDEQSVIGGIDADLAALGNSASHSSDNA